MSFVTIKDNFVLMENLDSNSPDFGAIAISSLGFLKAIKRNSDNTDWEWFIWSPNEKKSNSLNLEDYKNLFKLLDQLNLQQLKYLYDEMPTIIKNAEIKEKAIEIANKRGTKGNQ